MLYINDLVILGNFEKKIDWFKEQLVRGFNMMDLG
jgi:hypothetical protein